ncbi:MAG: alpha/beta fold hydrolase, partial [Phaeodactylibacter sp.]|nr:alpha/beta fold hydrolase [Phaeodactylibacter sp.]
MKVIDCLFYCIVIGLNSQVNAQNITPKKLPNIVYIFSSDNGPWLVMEALGGSAGHLREGKNYTFEGFEGYAGSPWKQAVAAHDTLLFDLRTDPGETRNLYPENRDLGKRLLEEMKQQYQNLGPFPPSLVVRTASDNSHFEILAARRQKIDQPDQGYIEVDGSKLKYVVEGEGTPCLVIGSSIYYPKTFSADLRKNLKMYFVDLKWFAEDYKPENLDSVNIASIVQDVEEIRAKLGLENPILMGHSIHGTIAMEYVKEHPDQVRGLVLIGSPAEWGNATYEKKAAALWQTASSERKALQEQNWGK